MRELTTPDRLERFIVELGRRVKTPTRVYLAGGATAVLHGWRPSTVDIDLSLRPDSDEALRAIRDLKDELSVNVELASPHDFIPAPTGWEERSVFVRQEGAVAFLHLDPYSQCLSKLERGHRQDMEDAAHFVSDGLVQPGRLHEMFDEIERELHRFPAIDPETFRRSVERFVDAGPPYGQESPVPPPN